MKTKHQIKTKLEEMAKRMDFMDPSTKEYQKALGFVYALHWVTSRDE